MENKRPKLSDSPTKENENIKETTKDLNEDLLNVRRTGDEQDSTNTEVAPCMPVKEDSPKEKENNPKNDVNNDTTKINDIKEKIVYNKTTDNSNDNATVIVGENVETVIAKVPETNEQKENTPERNKKLKSGKASVSSEEKMPKKNQDASTLSEDNVSGDLKDKESTISSSESDDINSETESADEKQDVHEENDVKQDIIKTEALDKITEDVVKISLKEDNEVGEKNISKESEKNNASTEITVNSSENEAEGNADEKVTVSEENEALASTSNDDIKSHASDEAQPENESEVTEVSADSTNTEDNTESTTEVKNKSESNGEDSENDDKDDYVKIKNPASLIPPIAFNPCLADGEIDEHELNRLRGDAIGDTMYSERFVLATLLNLHAVTSKCLAPAFEKDLCSLWDMTTEEDVVKLLSKYGVFELFTPIIRESTDSRLHEILIGIIGNMCYFECAREDLVNRYDTMATILALVSDADTLVLIQLMRLLVTALDNKSPIESYKWFQHFRLASQDFVMSMAHILNNCLSEEVLSGTLHALSVITSRFSMLVTDEFEEEPDANEQSEKTENIVYDFSDIFVDSSLITSVMQGFQRLVADWELSPLDDENDGPYGKNTRRTTLNYLLIHTHICNCGSNSTDIYNEHKEEFIATTNAILRPLSVPAGLLPLKQFQYDVVDQIYEFYMALEYPTNKECLKILLMIWSIIRRRKKKQRRQRSPNNDFEDESSTNREMSSDFMLCVLRKFISYHLIHLSHKETKEIMAANNIDNLYSFMRNLDTNSVMEGHMTNVIDNYIEKKTKKKTAT